MLPLRTAVLVVLVLTPSVGAQNLIVNGTFDEDIAGWATLATVGASVEWTPDGRHGGGILMEGTGITTVGGGLAWSSDCLHLEPGLHTLEGDVFMEGVAPFGLCGIYRRRYMTPDCTGSNGVTDAFTTINGEWVTLESQFVVTDSEGDSFEVVLQTSILGGTGERRCIFDNISLVGPTPPTLEIPTSSPLGLGGLFLALAIAGLAALGARPGLRSSRP